MKFVCGWALPDDDTYFPAFLERGETFQLDHLEAALQRVTDWSAALDGGAHVGFWTLELARRFRHVLAFEPNPKTFECLYANTKPHRTVVALYRAALMDRPGTVEPCRDLTRQGNTGSNFVAMAGPAGRGPIPALRVDDLGLTSLGLLKLDLEGAEFLALAGARETIKKFQPVVIMETDKPFEFRFNGERGAAEKAILAMGYREVAHLRPDKVFVAA